MEHFSRLTQKDIDLLLLVSDPTRRGLSTACRIAGLVKGLPMRVSRIMLVINQVREEPESWPEEVRLVFGNENICCFPADPLVSTFDLDGKPTSTLPGHAPVVKAAERLFDRIFSKPR
jgi:CO dehydrogenase maturation factor